MWSRKCHQGKELMVSYIGGRAGSDWCARQTVFLRNLVSWNPSDAWFSSLCWCYYQSFSLWEIASQQVPNMSRLMFHHFSSILVYRFLVWICDHIALGKECLQNDRRALDISACTWFLVVPMNFNHTYQSLCLSLTYLYFKFNQLYYIRKRFKLQ